MGRLAGSFSHGVHGSYSFYELIQWDNFSDHDYNYTGSRARDDQAPTLAPMFLHFTSLPPPSVDAPAHEALDAPLDGDLGHGQAAATLHPPPVLLVECLAERVPGGRGGGWLVPRVHPPRDVHRLGGVGRGPGAGGGHGARARHPGPGVRPAGLDGHSDHTLLLLSARVREAEPQVLLSLC